MTTLWDKLDPSVVAAAKDIAEAGKFDDAIFAAYRLVEHTIQLRIKTNAVGLTLVDEAFEGRPPKLLISEDERDQSGIRDLFAGAFGTIRNDRGHKNRPNITCESLDTCLLYLAFASLLLVLLKKDKSLYPRIESLRVLGSETQPRLEIRGKNFSGTIVTVTCADSPAEIVRSTPESIEIVLPRNFSGDIAVTSDGRPSNREFCNVGQLSGKLTNFYEVVATELPLFSDPQATQRRSDVVGVLIRATEGAREFIRIIPEPPGKVKAATYITHGPYDRGQVVGETWFRHPSTGAIEYAWTSSLVSRSETVGPVNNFKLGSIAIRPKLIELTPAESRSARVIGLFTDGIAVREEDVTDRADWNSSSTNIVYVKDGSVLAKRFGEATIRAQLEAFMDTAEVRIAQIPHGHVSTYFQGLRNLQQIAFDSDDALYVCNQSPSIYRISAGGEFKEVLKIASSPTIVAAIDCLAVDQQKNLYVNFVARRTAYKFEWDGKSYGNPVEFGKSIDGPKKGIATTPSGSLFFAVMGPPNRGWLVRRDLDGHEFPIPIDGMPIWIASGPTGKIYIPIGSRGTVLVYSESGILIEEIPHGIMDSSVTGIFVEKDESVYLAFQSGKVLRIAAVGKLLTAEYLPHSFGIPGGLAMDSRRRLFVSDFSGDAVKVLW